MYTVYASPNGLFYIRSPKGNIGWRSYTLTRAMKVAKEMNK